MDFGMRVCPSFTCKATGSLMRKFSPKVKSFYPIYQEQIENKKDYQTNEKGKKRRIEKEKKKSRFR